MSKKNRKASAPRADLYQAVTDRIIAALEAGTKPWARDWAGGLQLRACGKEYRGINQLLLSLTAMQGGYLSPYWLTFKQALDLGGSVRKGERSTEIVFYKQLTFEDRDQADAGEGEGEESGTRSVRLLRSYRVFNADQCDGLPDRFKGSQLATPGKQRDEAAEAALRSSGATIREGGVQAFYNPGGDFVQLPPFDLFASVGGYLATMAHELTHWTGHSSRLDRLKGSRFGSPDYAREELVAEIGAAFICARLGIAGEHIDNHAAYLASWLKVLRSDKRAIFTAAAQAQTAADLVLVNAGEGAEAIELEPTPAAEPERERELEQLELLAA